MADTTSQPNEPHKKPPAISLSNIVPVAIVLGLIGLGIYGYFHYTAPVATPVDPATLFNGYLSMKDREFDLDKAYTDADKDLVADFDPNAKEPDTLTFCEIPSSKLAEDEITWAPLIQHLSTATGKKWVYLTKLPSTTPLPPKSPPPVEPGDEPASAAPTTKTSDTPRDEIASFDDQLDAMRAGSLHLTAFTTGQVRRAVNTAGFVPLVVPANAAGEFSYQLQIVVSAKSSIKTLADLKGKSIAIPALSSNSGAKAVFTTLLDKAQLNPRGDYSIKLVAGYQGGLKEITSGTCDAMGIASDLFAREVKAGRISAENYRLIDTQQTYPKLCYGVSHKLPKTLAQKIDSALQSFKFSGNSVGNHFAGDSAEKYIPVSYITSWEPVRLVDQRLLEILKK
jgi:phosphonate transport system substrate-binding protein